MSSKNVSNCEQENSEEVCMRHFGSPEQSLMAGKKFMKVDRFHTFFYIYVIFPKYSDKSSTTLAANWRMQIAASG